ncbi:MAG: hypothetical protein ABID54_08025 [Pseudomonadota bacterium]
MHPHFLGLKSGWMWPRSIAIGSIYGKADPRTLGGVAEEEVNRMPR